MRLTKEQLKLVAKSSINIIFTSLGIAMAGYGAWLIYEPAAFIVVGGAVFYLGLPE